MIVLMELEVWPNLLAIAERRGIPVVVVNGRVTERRSMKRFGKPIIRQLAARMFGRLAWVGAQDATYAERFAALGTPTDRVHVTGSLKFDGATIADRVDGQDALAAAMGFDLSRSIWVAGSTGTDEEAIVLDALEGVRATHDDVQLAIIPRKPERFDEVARLIEQRGLACVRRSSHRDGGGAATGLEAGESADRPRVWLGDTMGELRKFYALADVVFVGRSLVPMGGSDMIEVAALGKAPILGPHTENFASAVRAFEQAGATAIVEDAAALADAVVGLLDDPGRRSRLNDAARDVVRAGRGATGRTVDALCELLGYRADHPPRGVATPPVARVR
jgi:3-deoxy-D-manno-octulosonic-acid transferase